MPRRRQKDHWIVPAAQIVGLLVLLCFVSPQARQTVIGLGYMLLAGMAILAGLALFVMLWRNFQAPDDQLTTLNANLCASGEPRDFTVSVAPPNHSRLPLSPTEALKRLRAIDWFQFEQLVGLLYSKQGYAVTRRGGANPDGGIDLLIEKNGVRTAVQCKHWKTWNVGVKAVREFLGAMADAQLRDGLFITLGGYTGQAKTLADKQRIGIVNQADLVRMLEQTNAALDPAVSRILNDHRKLCPKCESEMRLKTAQKGRGVGKQFWACSRYPRCWFTMPVN